MYRLTLFRVLVCTALAVVPLAANVARADQPGDEFDRLSRRLEREAKELREEVLVIFRDRPHYGDLVSSVQEIERLAESIHEMKERGEARPRRVREALEKLDDLVRQVEHHLDELGRAKDIDRRAYERARDDLSDMSRVLYRLRKEL
jgi:chromosome segregation ATPase